MTKSATNALLLGQWGTLLGQQKWRTQSPQQKYRLSGDGGCHMGNKKGGTRSLQEKLLIGQWRTPLGQQKRGTQMHRCLGNGGRRSGNKNGGLKVHNISMDAAWATNMGDSKFARKIADRVMRDAAWATKMRDSKSSRAMGDAAWATENGGLRSPQRLYHRSGKGGRQQKLGSGGGNQRLHQITIKNNIRGWIHIPQQKYCRSGKGGHHSGEKNWGLQVSSKNGIPAWMIGDAAHAKIMRD
jgi:hypothetical protein